MHHGLSTGLNIGSERHKATIPLQNKSQFGKLTSVIKWAEYALTGSMRVISVSREATKHPGVPPNNHVVVCMRWHFGLHCSCCYVIGPCLLHVDMDRVSSQVEFEHTLVLY